MTLVPTFLSVASRAAALKDASRRYRDGRGPYLTAAARDARGASGRDEETVHFSRTKKHDPQHGKSFLHNLTDTTHNHRHARR